MNRQAVAEDATCRGCGADDLSHGARGYCSACYQRRHRGGEFGFDNERMPNAGWAWEPPPPWTQDALCAETDPDAFFPEKGGSTRDAKAVCGQCTVAAECLTYALDHEERFGIWGGLSERERRKLRHLTPSRETGWPSTTTATTHLEEPA